MRKLDAAVTCYYSTVGRPCAIGYRPPRVRMDGNPPRKGVRPLPLVHSRFRGNDGREVIGVRPQPESATAPDGRGISRRHILWQTKPEMLIG